MNRQENTLFTDLKNVNHTFEHLMNRRFEEWAGQGIFNLRKTRMDIDKIYTQIIDQINAQILFNGENAYSDFVHKLNKRVCYFKNTLSQRKGRNAAKKEMNPDEYYLAKR